MRRLEVDIARDGLGGLVGTIEKNQSDTVSDTRPYTLPSYYTYRVELSPEEVRQLRELWDFSQRGDGKQQFPLVTVPREIFEKVVRIWIV